MTTVQFTDHAVMLAMLAEHQDKLEEEVDKATIEYIHAQEYARKKLQDLREWITLRDAMTAVRKHVGGVE